MFFTVNNDQYMWQAHEEAAAISFLQKKPSRVSSSFLFCHRKTKQMSIISFYCIFLLEQRGNCEQSESCENQMCNCRIPGQLCACRNRETVITTSRIRGVGKGMFTCTVGDTRQQSHSDILSAFQSYFLFYNNFL